MSIDSLWKSIVGETMFPPRTPFFWNTQGTFRFPTPLPAHVRGGRT
jgi:hypothetical protein